MKHQRLAAAAAAAVVAALGAFGAAASPAQSPAAPINDNYIDSLEINKAGTVLNRTDTIRDVRDTTDATVQSDIFNPPQSGGPAETTTCGSVSYGKTIWYDFHPDRAGTVRIRTSGFDNVVALYTFNTQTLIPHQLGCVHQSSFPDEELDAKVAKGLAYTIQIGGANGAAGQLQLLFDFFANPPHRLTAQANLKAQATSTGIKLLSLGVTTARTAHVKVSCGRFCRSQSKLGHATETFPRLNGVQMPAGSALTIRVTAKGSIGSYIRYKVLAGNFNKITRCTEPGSRKPRRKCH